MPDYIAVVKKNSYTTKVTFTTAYYRIHQRENAINIVNTNSNSSQVVLSGASGMVGAALQRGLAGAGMRVLQLVRAKTPGRMGEAALLPGAVGVAIPGQFPWDPAATPPVTPAHVLEGFTAAIHLSGANVAAHRWTASYKREIAVSRVQTTRALAEALAGLRNPPRTLLVASATGIYGDRGDEPLDETSATGRGFLADVCRDWEAAAQPARDAGIRVVNLRFGIVIGAGGALARMAPIFRLGLGGPLGHGSQWMPWISTVDLVRAVLFVLQTPSLDGPVNITAPAPVTNAAFTRALAAQLGRPAFLPAPAFALRLAFGQMADEALLAGARVYPAKLTNAGFAFTHPNLAAALAAALPPRGALS